MSSCLVKGVVQGAPEQRPWDQLVDLPSPNTATLLSDRKETPGQFLRLEIKFKYYLEITKQIKSLLSGCRGLPLDNTFNEDYCPPGYSLRFAFYYQRTTYALL